MKTVKDVSQLTGLSVRTLHYYDEIGLLPPTMVGENGYRFYDAAALRRLQDILLFRELAFPLKTIKQLLDSPSYDQQAALTAQIRLLELRKAHLEKVIAHARTLQKGGETMTFEVYSQSQLEAFQLEAKERWGQTEAYSAYEDKTKQLSSEQLIKDLQELFAAFGRLLDQPVAELAVQHQVKALQDYISKHCYACSNELLAALGLIYLEDERFKTRIDHMGGAGTAAFVSQAISYYCQQ
ncbi:MerR family transcriptional regulator [Streptococcus equi]|uniref:MerR family transcriptional regulator n=1 Tax=Streptococcus equi TaxID=1336 RepID=UPI000DFAED03|nr:MerR family transcriptional regulator [Streptococcus equi]SUN52635.1 MerR family transcriptional regulator [Streptococcus equi subsp. zooepidemicus]HEL0423366.1 MerR family transcriptional regulator [Streptococcus equi subsp. zooepidemicus]HEL0468022.1 MerR family transcriptional regulator [Streptococcus equi subsp. zooepidemicus]HEL0484106.1 MerR family transcriptional regulator [Streptococcus equi subsp. zooepidemicus]HEL0488033.1 MerR family transcriptional regulator [Streptococcus equi 